MRSAALLVVALVAAVAAAVAVNVLLLDHGVARHDPVGRLSPVVATNPAPAQPPVTTTRREPDD